MLRKPRLDAPGALHHVIVRGIERGEIFRSKIELIKGIKPLDID
ncbi:MAG: hypothetical protein AB1797_04825 [bacterium]